MCAEGPRTSKCVHALSLCLSATASPHLAGAGRMRIDTVHSTHATLAARTVMNACAKSSAARGKSHLLQALAAVAAKCAESAHAARGVGETCAYVCAIRLVCNKSSVPQTPTVQQQPNTLLTAATPRSKYPGTMNTRFAHTCRPQVVPAVFLSLVIMALHVLLLYKFRVMPCMSHRPAIDARRLALHAMLMAPARGPSAPWSDPCHTARITQHTGDNSTRIGH